jgi:hypothetical protein
MTSTHLSSDHGESYRKVRTRLAHRGLMRPHQIPSLARHPGSVESRRS